jgi:hypothetical protein
MQRHSLHPGRPGSAPGLRLLPLSAALALCFVSTVPAATITVNSNSAGSVSGACTLLDAVTSANTHAVAPGSNCAAGSANGANTIVFAPGITDIVFTAPVAGTASALQVTSNLTIDGGAVPGSGVPKVTLERGGVSAFRLIDGRQSNLALKGLTLRNGHTAGNNQSGGAVYGGILAVYDSVIAENSTSGKLAYGGGIYASNIAMFNSTVSGNSTTGFRSTGGGVDSYSFGITITSSIISGNTTAGSYADGGGISTGNVADLVLKNSTVSGNGTTGSHARGGGIAAETAQVTNSSIDHNRVASAVQGQGGGIFCGRLILTNSTVSTNSAMAGGGGIEAIYESTLQFSTITGNSVDPGGIGAGVEFYNAPFSTLASIIFGNSGASDIDSPATSVTVSGYTSLIGTHGAHVVVPSDTRTCNPLLGPLGFNGGPTRTHGLLTGSCAINAGPADPFFAGVEPPTPITTDQRGTGFARVVGASSDIGAFEKQGPDDPDLIFSNGFESN